jgi:alpha-beta hydrolase superfamily lysophospholipase
MPRNAFVFRAEDGALLQGRRWLPDGMPKAVVQVAHGLAEHDARYARLAGALNAAGYGVYANDHRGHGASCDPADLGHFADADGWAKCVGDLWTFNRLIAAEQPGLPIVFLGHSMGSFLGRQFVAERADALRLRLGKRGKRKAHHYEAASSCLLLHRNRAQNRLS